MNHWMFNCREVTRLVSESLDRNMTLGERIGIKMHLWMCKLCPEVMQQMLYEGVKSHAEGHSSWKQQVPDLL